MVRRTALLMLGISALSATLVIANNVFSVRVGEKAQLGPLRPQPPPLL